MTETIATKTRTTVLAEEYNVLIGLTRWQDQTAKTLAGDLIGRVKEWNYLNRDSVDDLTGRLVWDDTLPGQFKIRVRSYAACGEITIWDDTYDRITVRAAVDYDGHARDLVNLHTETSVALGRVARALTYIAANHYNH